MVFSKLSHECRIIRFGLGLHNGHKHLRVESNEMPKDPRRLDRLCFQIVLRILGGYLLLFGSESGFRRAEANHNKGCPGLVGWQTYIFNQQSRRTRFQRWPAAVGRGMQIIAHTANRKNILFVLEALTNCAGAASFLCLIIRLWRRRYVCAPKKSHSRSRILYIYSNLCKTKKTVKLPPKKCTQRGLLIRAHKGRVAIGYTIYFLDIDRINHSNHSFVMLKWPYDDDANTIAFSDNLI